MGRLDLPVLDIGEDVIDDSDYLARFMSEGILSTDEVLGSRRANGYNRHLEDWYKYNGGPGNGVI
jgi:hypothetical protein